MIQYPFKMTLVVVLGWLLSLAVPAAGLGEYNGETVTPPLRLKDTRGHSHNLADYQGKVVLVNFWASWCAPCLQELPEMRKLGERMSNRAFSIIAINVEEPVRKVEWLVEYLAPHIMILLDRDREVFNAWDGTVLPTSYLVDRRGRIRYGIEGPFDWDSAVAVSAVEELLSEGPGIQPISSDTAVH